MPRTNPGQARPCDRRGVRFRRANTLHLAAALVLAACGGGGADGVGCGRMDGAWDVTYEDGTGPARTQRWLVAQTGCEVSLAVMAADGTGSALFTARGVAGSDGFWVTWSFTDGACRISGRVEANVTADTLDGTVSEARSNHGAGECLGAGLGIVMSRVRGARR